jgi:hypothetical protein
LIKRKISVSANPAFAVIAAIALTGAPADAKLKNNSLFSILSVPAILKRENRKINKKKSFGRGKTSRFFLALKIGSFLILWDNIH